MGLRNIGDGAPIMEEERREEDEERMALIRRASLINVCVCVCVKRERSNLCVCEGGRGEITLFF